MVTLSVVIPNLNYGRYLDQCLTSLFNQSFQDFEVILADSGSTDETFEVLKKFPKVKVVMDVPAKGPVHAVNKAVAIMQGKFFVQLNSDCWLKPEMYQRCISEFERNPALGFVYTGYSVVDDNGNLLNDACLPRFNRNILLERNFVDSSAMMIKKTCFDTLGVFDEKYQWTMDWIMAAKLSQKYPVKFIDEALFFYRVHGKQITADPRAKVYAELAKQKIKAYYPKRVVFYYDLRNLVIKIKNGEL